MYTTPSSPYCLAWLLAQGRIYPVCG